MQVKRCSKCGELKSLNEFYKQKGCKDGYQYECKICINKANRIWYKDNLGYKREQNKKYGKRWRENNSDKMREKAKRFKENNLGYDKQYRENNLDKIRKIKKRWREKNPDYYKKYGKEYKKRINLIPKNRLNHRISNSILKSLKRNKNGYHWEQLVSYNLEDLKQHLEQQFGDGMNWELFMQGKIHIDHIIPISLWEFDSYEDKEFKQCWAMCNLQPLWASENLAKGNKVI